jgi:signal transduction histidine kinase
MQLLGDIYQWLSGGPDGYMTLVHCMKGDKFWITLTVILDLLVAAGYLLIARHWWENEKSLPASHAKTALGQMKRIFLFCGTCGYLFIPIKLIWPAWRLYDGVMIVLVFITWRYALNARQLRVVYHELGRSKQLAYELAESRAESKRKSFFLNAISHDLRTPLNGLMLQADLAELSVGDEASLRESLREIKDSARTTADLLSSFMELGRLDWSDDSSRVTIFAAADLVNHVMGQARTVADRKGLKFSYEVPPGLMMRTDRIKVERIAQNLVNNAVKFTERGEVRLVVSARGRDALLEVIDTGVGISPDDLEAVFQEFFQVRNGERDNTKGFGLGLSIARRLVEQLKGQIVVESIVGQGSSFSVVLPGVVEGAAPVRSTPELNDAVSRGNSSSTALG